MTCRLDSRVEMVRIVDDIMKVYAVGVKNVWVGGGSDIRSSSSGRGCGWDGVMKRRSCNRSIQLRQNPSKLFVYVCALLGERQIYLMPKYDTYDEETQPREL
jgi:hypothetical protein